LKIKRKKLTFSTIIIIINSHFLSNSIWTVCSQQSKNNNHRQIAKKWPTNQ